MRCLKRRSIAISPALSILLLVAANPEQCAEKLTEEQVDSYCQLYTRIIVNKGDEQIKAPLDVKKRLLVNEKLYHRFCLKKA